MADKIDPNRTVDEVRSFCKGKYQAQSDAVKALGEAYAALVRDANARLRECDDLVQKGLRDEALQLADREPVLLDLVAKLQFPELPAWEELCGAFGYPSPPQLLQPSAEAINRAYADRDAVKSHQREHRRLALARAPLVERLAVLRRLAELEPNVAAWQDDLGAYDEARQRELRTAVEDAFARRADAQAHNILNELIESPWRVPPTPEFLKPIVRQYMEVLARSAELAQRREDLTSARKYLGDWERIADAAGVAAVDPIARRVDAVRRVVEKDDRRNVRQLEFQAALTALDEGLRDGATADDLRALYADAKEFPFRIPRELEEYYSDHMESLKRKRKTMEWIVIGVSFAGGALVLLFFFLFVVFRHK